jgi:hypothetical protein
MCRSLDDIFDSVLFSISGVVYKMKYWRLVIRREEDSISMSSELSTNAGTAEVPINCMSLECPYSTKTRLFMGPGK